MAFAALSRNISLLRTRSDVESAIERLIAMLDDIDGDPDLEDGFDLEAACEDEGHDSDREPWLGALEGSEGTRWTAWAPVVLDGEIDRQPVEVI